MNAKDFIYFIFTNLLYLITIHTRLNQQFIILDSYQSSNHNTSILSDPIHVTADPGESNRVAQFAVKYMTEIVPNSA